MVVVQRSSGGVGRKTQVFVCFAKCKSLRYRTTHTRPGAVPIGVVVCAAVIEQGCGGTQ